MIGAEGRDANQLIIAQVQVVVGVQHSMHLAIQRFQHPCTLLKYRDENVDKSVCIY